MKPDIKCKDCPVIIEVSGPGIAHCKSIDLAKCCQVIAQFEASHNMMENKWKTRGENYV